MPFEHLKVQILFPGTLGELLHCAGLAQGIHRPDIARRIKPSLHMGVYSRKEPDNKQDPHQSGYRWIMHNVHPHRSDPSDPSPVLLSNLVRSQSDTPSSRNNMHCTGSE